MSHDYAYTVKVGSGSHEALSTWADAVRVLPEISAGHRARNHVIPYRHGEATNARKWFGSMDLFLEIFLKYGTPEDPATVYTNRSNVLKRFSDNTTTVWLGRTAPYQGDVEIPVEVIRDVRTSTPRHKLMLGLRALDPFWREQAQSSQGDVTSGCTTGGDAPVGDAVFTFAAAGAGAIRATHTASSAYLEVTDISGTNVVVDCGNRTVVQGGSDVDAKLTVSDGWWIELAPGANAFSVSGTGTVSATWYDKWL